MKKGFTLIELLAVIVVMGILMGVAVPSVTRIILESKTKMFCEKISTIEAAGQYYGQDQYKNQINTSETILENKVSLMYLIKKGYLSKDENTCTLGENCIEDPRTKDAMDNTYVQIYTKNKRIYARYLYNEDDAKNKVCGSDIEYSIDRYDSNGNLRTDKFNFDVNGYKYNFSTKKYELVYSGDMGFEFDLYIDGNKVASKIGDYCSSSSEGAGISYGSYYELKITSYSSGYKCTKVADGSDGLTGYVTKNIGILVQCDKA